jgi:hypothetical protein
MEAETRKHIMQVAKYLHIFSCELLNRATLHDASKLKEPEASIFEEFTPKLKGSTYGSPEYSQFLKDMKPALDHHYANNSHHPEYFSLKHAWINNPSFDPIGAMTLFDLVEMICDWAAAVKRHEDGDIDKSILINKKRFNISEQVVYLLSNTAKELQAKEDRLDGIDPPSCSCGRIGYGPVICGKCGGKVWQES